MPLGTPRELLERAMAALIDVFGEMRPILVGCVEGYPAALREEALRERLAAAYGKAREAGVRMLRRAAAEAGIELPVAPEVLVSVVIAISDGLMIQWLIDPESTPDSRQVVDALAAISAGL
ncbi:TetR family transcriptional regulator C-terminal domain-containing protein [Nonomuraea sp. NPDC049649]|uniref:TetR family transcriptional regulator C-terminal domain-containing protein n=1 Tax=Nonomuraea sp. NPDC049649 TaxID=3155776 RepID=UPI0034324B5C